MNNFFDEIRLALDHKLYYLALFSSLCVPDICGAISSSNGEAEQKKYRNWFNKYYPKKILIGDNEIDNCITAEICWELRCSILHQGSSTKGFKKTLPNKHNKILFTLPDPNRNSFHCNKITKGSNTELNIDLEKFCNDMLKAAEQWLLENKNKTNYEKNISKFLEYYPQGFSSILGVSVLSNY